MLKQFVYITFTMGFFLGSSGYCSFEDFVVGAQYNAMGGSGVGFAKNSDAIFLNCSGLPLTNAYEVAVYYSNPFSMKELSLGTLSCAIPFRRGTIGLAGKVFGNQLYQENTFLLSYASVIYQKIYYGFSLRFYQLSISRYNYDSALGVDVGFLAVINPRLTWGFYSQNINRSRISEKMEPLPQIFSTGFSFNIVNDVTVNFDIYKDVLFPIEYRFGMQYFILNRLALRSGFATEPARFTAGFGILVPAVSIDYAITTHTDLGATHQFSLSFSIQKRTTSKDKPPQPSVISFAATKININTATIEELQQIKGIGPTLARRIIEYRDQQGLFNNIEQLKNVKGIGEKVFEKIKPYIVVE